MQLTLFDTKPIEEEKKKYPWLTGWPEWMPIVGELAEMRCVILNEYGYVYMDMVRINSIDGDDIVCTTEFKAQHMNWKEGRIYKCKIWELWPPVYHYNRFKNERGVSETN